MSKFTDFFTKATPEEKKKVFTEVARLANEEQQAVLDEKVEAITPSQKKQ